MSPIAFYQFQLKEMGSWFGIDFPKVASEWAEHGFEVDTVYNEERGIQERVRPDEVLYPVIQVMPMGWTWALFFANETVASIVREKSAKDMDVR